MRLFHLILLIWFAFLLAVGCSHTLTEAGKDAKVVVSQTDGQSSQLFGEAKEKLQEEYLRLLSHFATRSAVKTYVVFTGKLPEEQKDLGRTLLFKVPVDTVQGWKLTDDALAVTYSFMVDGKITTSTPLVFSPGSEGDLKRTESHIERAVQRMKDSIEKGIPVNYTEDDIRSGRVPIDYFDKLRFYSRNQEEYHQMLWSSQVAGLLGHGVRFYRQIYGVYPKNAEELFAFMGEPNWEAWVSPLTGKKVGIGKNWNSADVVYRTTTDQRGYEVLVPLFGAGTENPTPPGAIETIEFAQPYFGYYPGRYIRSSAAMHEDDVDFNPPIL